MRNAACVVYLVDHLIHDAEVDPIESESYRLKESRERAEQRAKKRTGKGKNHDESYPITLATA